MSITITDEMVDRAWATFQSKLAGRFGADLPTVPEVLRDVLTEFAAALAAQPQPVALLQHVYAGDCPDERQPDARDPECPACRALDAQHAEPGFMQQIAAARESVRQWPQWMQDAAVTASTQPAERVPMTLPPPNADLQAIATTYALRVALGTTDDPDWTAGDVVQAFIAGHQHAIRARGDTAPDPRDERIARLEEAAQRVTTDCVDKTDHFEVPSHVMAALALALDELGGTNGR